ncbi:MAG: type II toxin-antitoxin system death-on-curing family toxin [Phycisphaerae bacterium]|nr:type II toxin-antitoxin system death-on-curing family toxin [Tepidisphaeraceae bacterium]
MVDEIQFLSVDDVLAIHEDTVANEGGSAGLRDLGLLEAAVMTPRQQFGGVYLHDGLAAMAAAYLFHIASNHPFVDGNKRAAAMSAIVFLDANNVARLPDPDAMTDMTLRVASGIATKAQLIAWMREQIGMT